MTITHLGHDTVPLAKLEQYPGNPRVGDIDAIRESLRLLGQYRDLVVRVLDDGRMVLLAGNHTAQAMGLEGWDAGRCELISCDDDTAGRIVAADNRIPDRGGYDPGALADLLASFGGDLAGTGYDAGDLADLLDDQRSNTPARRTDPDFEPPKPEDPVTRKGDIIRLGRHVLVCGDATDPRVVAACGGDTAVMVCTDPPYCSGGFQEIARSAGSVGTNAEAARKHKQVANDRLSTRGYMALIKSVLALTAARYLYSFTDWRMWVNLFDAVESSGFGVRNLIVWDKGTPGMGRGWRAQHEIVMWAAKQTAPYRKHDPGQGNVLACKRTGNPLHTTQKPVEIVAQLLTVAFYADHVYDPFAGAGTTLIACEDTGRTCHLAELDPGYCDVTIERFTGYTGTEAVRAGRVDL